MSILDSIKNAFTNSSNNSVANAGRNLAQQFFRMGNRNKPMEQNWSQVVMSDSEFYKGYPYAAINNRANRVVQLAQSHLTTDALSKVIADYKNKKDELIHPYLSLIDISPTFSNTKFWYDISTYLDLEGVYYLLAVRAISDTKVGQVQEFKLLNPYNVKRIVNETTGELGGYVEFKHGLQREIPKEMIIEIRKLNPFSDTEAFAMTDAAAEAQFTMKQSGNYTRFSLKNNMSAPGIITTDIQMEDERFENFVSRIKNQEKGDPLFGNGEGSIKWNPMQIDLDKASLGNINEINRQELFAVSGVGKTMLAIEESGTTRDTAKVQKDLFTEYHALPQVQLIIDALNQDYKNNYAKDYDTTGITIKVDNPTGVDKDAQIKDVQVNTDSFALYSGLLQAGYDGSVAAKYVNGSIGLEDLGEPTNPPTSDTTGVATSTDSVPDGDKPDAKLLEDASPKDDSGAKNGFDVNARYSSIKPLIDGSVSLVFRTEQVKQEKINEMLAHYRKTGKLSFTADDDADADIHDDGGPTADGTDEDATRVKKDNHFLDQKNFNPYHGPDGRFTTEGGLAAISSQDIATEPKLELYDGNGDADISGYIGPTNTPYSDPSQEISYREDNGSQYFGENFTNSSELDKERYSNEIINKHPENTKFDEALSQYAGSREYSLINTYLRHPEEFTKDRYKNMEDFDATKNKMTKLLPDIKKATTQDEVTTPFASFRSGAFTESYMDQFGVGNVVKDSGFVSTSLDLDYSINFGSRRVDSINSKVTNDNEIVKPVVFRILNDTGQRGVWSDPHRDNKYKEYEWIPAYDSKYEVTNVAKSVDEHGNFNGGVVELKVIQDKDTTIPIQQKLINTAKIQDDVADKYTWVAGDLRFIKPTKEKSKEKNDFKQDVSVSNTLQLLQSSLKTGVMQVETQLVSKMMSQVTQNAFDSESNIITQKDKKEATRKLSLVLMAFYASVISLFGKRVITERLKQYGENANFKYNTDIKRYTKQLADKVAESHVDTVTKDIHNTIQSTYNETVKSEAEKIAKLAGRSVNDADLVLARQKAMEGIGRQKLISEITNKYQNITKTRATAIARTETNRAFTQSQYQADTQFLQQNDLMNNAYKVWQTRSDNPCVFCKELESRGPIPFKNDFASVGDELVVATTVNGKTKVNKLPINFEDLQAGNAHVNCGCQYKLVIKNDDGTIWNFTSMNIAENYNPNHDELGRFAAKSGDAASMITTESKTKKAISNSKYKKPLYHGTSIEAAESITKEGFKIPETGGVTFWGNYIYMTSNRDVTKSYAGSGDQGRVIKSYVDIRNPYVTKVNGENGIDRLIDENGKKKGYWEDYVKDVLERPAEYGEEEDPWLKSTYEVMADLMKTHDAVILKLKDEDMVMLRDPKSVHMVESKPFDENNKIVGKIPW